MKRLCHGSLCSHLNDLFPLPCLPKGYSVGLDFSNNSSSSHAAVNTMTMKIIVDPVLPFPTDSVLPLPVIMYLLLSFAFTERNLWWPCTYSIPIVVVFISRIQRIGCQPKKLVLFYTAANPARGLLNREKRTKEKVWQRTPPPHPPRCSFGKNK